MAPAQDYAKLKVAELKAPLHAPQELLKERSLPLSGLKADLVARLDQADAAAAVPDPLSTSADDTAPAPQVLQDAAHPAQPDPEQQALGGMGDAPPPFDGVNLPAKRALEDAVVDEEVKRIRTDAAIADAVPPADERDSGTAAGQPRQVRDAPAFASAPDLAQVGDGPNERVIAEGKVATETLVKAANGELPREEQEQEAEEEEEEEEPPVYEFEREEEGARPADLYLDTINRSALDFDFERLCSVTLSHNHIYACLVDGKYFQGRGKSSPAYAHALNDDHHVFINLETQKVYVLPDGYEVDDASLADIKSALYPRFTPQLLKRIDAALTPSLDLAQRPYYPGFVGLNNMKHNSFMNACLHLLLHVPPLRDYFILNPLPSSSSTSELVRRFGMFARKLWNPKQFKAQVSPHELLQEVGNASGGRFRITQEGDPVEFLGWLLNQLHRDLGGTRKPRSSIIYSAFQGEVRVDDQQIIKTGEFGTKPKFDLDRDIKTTKTPFLFLALDLPPPPLFQDAVESNIAPQAPLAAILAKYDGRTTREDTQAGVLRRWKITRLPPFLVVYYKRFTSNRFLEEKNPTIVNFPLRGVDMSDYVDPSAPVSAYYDLTANLTHTSLAGTAHAESQWRTHVHLRAPRDERGELKAGVKEEDEKWFEMEDLAVREIEREMVSLGETYVQIWERRTPTGTWDLPVETPKPKARKEGDPATSKK
ncbi:Ubiquitin carboxyl-terminal hydrolase 10 [Rhodotorula kratochvilovae]